MEIIIKLSDNFLYKETTGIIFNRFIHAGILLSVNDLQYKNRLAFDIDNSTISDNHDILNISTFGYKILKFKYYE
jgi:hypothetical protein